MKPATHDSEWPREGQRLDSGAQRGGEPTWLADMAPDEAGAEPRARSTAPVTPTDPPQTAALLD